MKPTKTDKKAPKILTLEIKNKNKVWGSSIGSLRQFKEGTGSLGYNFTARLQNPENGEAYMFSGNLVLIGSAPKTSKGKSKK